MLDPDFVAMLRCPMRPDDATLRSEGRQLICTHCEVRFAVKEGFPNMVMEEAILPHGCNSLDDLPCRRTSADKTPPG